MKALSISQPWATLLVLGRKRHETRSWRTEHRGWLLIHAAKKLPPAGRELFQWDPVRRLLAEAGIVEESALPRGAILGAVRVTGCLRTEDASEDAIRETDRLLGDYGPGRWFWLLEQAKVLPAPVPCRGQLGVFDVPFEMPGLE